MPIYEYLCEKCGHEFEREQRITADPIKTCPACKARKVKKLISQTSFVLKGGGWYNDLYSSTSKSGKGDKSDGADSTPDASSDEKGKSKSKPKKDSDAGKKTSKASKSAA